MLSSSKTLAPQNSPSPCKVTLSNTDEGQLSNFARTSRQPLLRVRLIIGFYNPTNSSYQHTTEVFLLGSRSCAGGQGTAALHCPTAHSCAGVEGTAAAEGLPGDSRDNSVTKSLTQQHSAPGVEDRTAKPPVTSTRGISYNVANPNSLDNLCEQYSPKSSLYNQHNHEASSHQALYFKRPFRKATPDDALTAHN